MKPLIESLPEKYKHALNQTTFNNQSQKDFAANEDLSYTAAKTRVQRARKMVKDLIVACCDPTTDVYGNVLEKAACKTNCGCED